MVKHSLDTVKLYFRTSMDVWEDGTLEAYPFTKYIAELGHQAVQNVVF